jgi:hypothetical protein
MKFKLILVVALSLILHVTKLSAQCDGITNISHCPDDGCSNSTTHPNDPMLNHLKNRTDAATGPQTMTLQNMRDLQQPTSWTLGQDRTPLQDREGRSIRITAYLVQLANTPSGHPVKNPKGEGAESCNCELTHTADVDWHCVLGATYHSAESTSVTAEVTPRIRANHPHWNVTALRTASQQHKRVRFTGWLMLDTYHIYHPIVRSTNWELHPITKIEIETSHNHWLNLDN